MIHFSLDGHDRTRARTMCERSLRPECSTSAWRWVTCTHCKSRKDRGFSWAQVTKPGFNSKRASARLVGAAAVPSMLGFTEADARCWDEWSRASTQNHKWEAGAGPTFGLEVRVTIAGNGHLRAPDGWRIQQVNSNLGRCSTDVWFARDATPLAGSEPEPAEGFAVASEGES